MSFPNSYKKWNPIACWWNAPAAWWQFWMPQSGGPGGAIMGIVIIHVVAWAVL